MQAKYLFTVSESSVERMIKALTEEALNAGFSEEDVSFIQKKHLFNKQIDIIITVEGTYVFQDKFVRALMHKFQAAYKVVKSFK